MENNRCVAVGCTSAQMVPFAVLRHSITKRASRPIEVYPLSDARITIPKPLHERNWPKTPFSFQRFIVPEFVGFTGLALYLDSDMLVFDDVHKLFDQMVAGVDILAVPRETSVMLIDCARTRWDIRHLVAQLDNGSLSYDAMMQCRSTADVRYCLPTTWNWLDNSPHGMPKHVSLLHYTTTTSQPWLSAGHPLGHLWMDEFFEALDRDIITPIGIQEAVDRRFIRPSLLYQVTNRGATKENFPEDVRKADADFAVYCRERKYWISGTT